MGRTDTERGHSVIPRPCEHCHVCVSRAATFFSLYARGERDREAFGANREERRSERRREHPRGRVGSCVGFG